MEQQNQQPIQGKTENKPVKTPMNKARLFGSICFFLLGLFFGYWSLGFILSSNLSTFNHPFFLLVSFMNFTMVFGINRMNKFFEIFGKIFVVCNGIIYGFLGLVLFIGIGMGISTLRDPLPWYSYLALFIVFLTPLIVYAIAAISFFKVLKQYNINKIKSVVQNP